jgi:hypothetical protein
VTDLANGLQLSRGQRCRLGDTGARGLVEKVIDRDFQGRLIRGGCVRQAQGKPVAQPTQVRGDLLDGWQQFRHLLRRRDVRQSSNQALGVPDVAGCAREGRGDPRLHRGIFRQ